MIIAASVGTGDLIVPIVEGDVLRIYNLETRQADDHANPAVTLTEGRRGAALRLAEQLGATAFVAPPETFCEISYGKAREAGVGFYKIGKGLTFSEFLKELDRHSFRQESELPAEDVVPS